MEQELSAPPGEVVKWKVWNLNRPAQYCTVEARTWFKARAIGAARMHTDKADAVLKP
jgi:hypothetical protein